MASVRERQGLEVQESLQKGQKGHHQKQRKGLGQCPGDHMAWTVLGAEWWEAPQDRKARFRLVCGGVLKVFVRLLGFTVR